MGRGHLIRAAAALAALAPAARTVACVAHSRSDAAVFSKRLGRGVSKLDQVSWKTTGVVAALADWGCNDNLVEVGDPTQKEAAVHALLVHGEPPAGTAGRRALYGVYRLLTVPKSALHKRYPTRAVIDVA